MKLWAISDLHLPGGQKKPMDIFGTHWSDHASKVAEAWRARIAPGDVVLMPGDLSWAMTLDQAAADFAFLGELPGRIVIVRGNHDYWWNSVSQVRAALPPNVTALQHDLFDAGCGRLFTGTRGWNLPGSEGFDAHDEKVYRRELNRLELGLRAAQAHSPDRLGVLLHYPPLAAGAERSEFTDLLEAFGVDLCVYGHLHDRSKQRRAPGGVIRGVRYALVSCDALDFTPLLLEDPEDISPLRGGSAPLE